MNPYQIPTNKLPSTISEELKLLMDAEYILPDGQKSDNRLEIAKVIVQKCMAGEERFIKLLMAYLEGAPTQKIESTVNVHNQHTVWTPAELLEMRRVQNLMNRPIEIQN
jgi:hypothetical protein